LLEPSEYRRDWAAEWAKWFDGGMAGLPVLKLNISQEPDDDSENN
jgi:hypothetical protein